MSSSLHGRRIVIITVSDRVADAQREDLTGPALVAGLTGVGANVTHTVIPDGAASVHAAISFAVASGADAVVTTGGTGVGPRDQTPEGTAPLLVQELPGIPELLRGRDAHQSPTVALSRNLAGMTQQGTLVINLPGSERAISSALEVLPTLVAHALAQRDGGDH